MPSVIGEADQIIQNSSPSRNSVVLLIDAISANSNNIGSDSRSMKYVWIQYSPGPSGGADDSESLKACQALLDEYLPQLKALPGATITRQVCGGCLDFKVSISQPLEEHGAWADADYQPLEGEFMEKLKAIEGTSVHETQEITFQTL